MINVLIVGSGAMSNAFAARLSGNKNCSIQIFSEWQEGIRVLNQKGIQLTRNGQTKQIPPISASILIEQIQPANLIFFLVKSWQTAEMAEITQQKLLPDGVCLTLQNGLGNVELLGNSFGEKNVNAGTTTMGVTLLAPGEVQIHADGSILLGEHPSNSWVIPLFQQSGFQVASSPNLESVIWGKLLINAVINPLTALMQIPNGGLDDNPYRLELVDGIIDEIEILLQLKRIQLPYPDAHQQVRNIICQSEHNHSSMVQDFQRHAPTEIDFITGAILHEARRYDLAMPINQTLYQLIKSMVTK
jgi:2-dehydropantoate 2-reductase